MPSRRSRHFQVVTPTDGLPTRKFMTAAGDGTGVCNLNGDYSVTPLVAYFLAAQRYELHSILINLSGGAKFKQSAYGDINAGTVTNGIKFYIQPPGGPDIQLLSDLGITSNMCWTAVTSEVNLTSFDLNAQTLIVNIDIVKQYGCTLTLKPGAKFKAVLNDNFSGLINHSFGLRGTMFQE